MTAFWLALAVGICVGFAARAGAQSQAASVLWGVAAWSFCAFLHFEFGAAP